MERGREGAEASLLEALGRSVRARRQARSLTMRALAEAAGVSERFLAQLEAGEGNISVVRLHHVADALGTAASALLSEAEGHRSSDAGAGVVSLLGLRGAGKSTVGRALAKRLGVPFIELDAKVEQAAGMSLATLFELHGNGYYRALEREVLVRTLAEAPRAVMAAGGGVVTDEETYALLRARTTTVWLRATADDHWRRVVAQGDARPMANRANAMSELRTLLDARAPLYAMAHVVVETASLTVRETVDAVAAALPAVGLPRRR